jgi:putative aldouronate transport system substrate-binding protein
MKAKICCVVVVVLLFAFAGASFGVEVEVMLKEHPAQPIRLDAPFWQLLEQYTGVKVELKPIPSSDYGSKLQVLLATGQIPDIISAERSHIEQFAGSGVVEPLNDLIDQYAPNVKAFLESDPNSKKMMIGGQYYHIPKFAVHKRKVARSPIWRQDIADELGLEEPETWDDLLNAFRAVKKAYPDMIPWTCRNKTEGLLEEVLYSMGTGYARGGAVYYDPDIEGGKWAYPAIRQEFKEGLKVLQTAYTEGLLDPDYATNGTSQLQEKLNSGKAFFYYDNNTFPASFNTNLPNVKEGARMMPIPVPKGFSGTARQYFYATNWLSSGHAISAKSKYKQEIIQMFNWMASEEGLLVSNWGVEGVQWKMGDNGVPALDAAIIEEARKSNDPYRGVGSLLGVGLLNFTVGQDDRRMIPFDPPGHDEYLTKLFGTYTTAYHEPVLKPPFTDEEGEKIKKLRAKLETFSLPAIDQFIIGQKSLDEFDEWAAKLKEMGGAELEDIYNTAEARVQ